MNQSYVVELEVLNKSMSAFVTEVHIVEVATSPYHAITQASDGRISCSEIKSVTCKKVGFVHECPKFVDKPA